MPEFNALSCAVVVIGSFTTAGLVQTAWLKSPLSWSLAWPLDGGLKVRGRRLFGDNKTFRGVVVLVPACAASFVIVSAVCVSAFGVRGLWPLGPLQWALLGALCGLGYLLAELPNSALKRQLDIAPGQAAPGKLGGGVFFLLDQLDSTVGVLVACACVVPVNMAFCVLVMGIGALWHYMFTLLLYVLGVKQRPA